MKRRLNILCVIVMLVLSYSVVESLYYAVRGVGLGVEIGMENVEKKKNPGKASNRGDKRHELTNMKYIALMPHAFSGKGEELLPDSIYNKKTGEYLPASYYTMAVSVKTRDSVIGSISYLLHVVAVVWAIILFIKIIVSINRSDIFNWRNVRRLRRLGVLLIIGFGLSLLSECLSLHSLREVLSLSNYDLQLSDVVDSTILVLGLAALIVAEVFSIGLKMKEEQELTI